MILKMHCSFVEFVHFISSSLLLSVTVNVCACLY